MRGARLLLIALLVDPARPAAAAVLTPGLTQPSKQKAKGENMRHPTFPRGREGPPPQYYPGSTVFNLVIRMGTGNPR